MALNQALIESLEMHIGVTCRCCLQLTHQSCMALQQAVQYGACIPLLVTACKGVFPSHQPCQYAANAPGILSPEADLIKGLPAGGGHESQHLRGCIGGGGLDVANLWFCIQKRHIEVVLCLWLL